ncbi:hypothetical protein BgiBS90_003308 [Biomphalaria glabrata]|nr:hypothetical protein BgiBS90_003307 [Biomphalaria glabrata]KAI8795541.1 hypothetical protein BgiBS90_003308 [Biomphalaria glabrata]
MVVSLHQISSEVLTAGKQKPHQIRVIRWYHKIKPGQWFSWQFTKVTPRPSFNPSGDTITSNLDRDFYYQCKPVVTSSLNHLRDAIAFNQI